MRKVVQGCYHNKVRRLVRIRYIYIGDAVSELLATMLEMSCMQLGGEFRPMVVGLPYDDCEGQFLATNS